MPWARTHRRSGSSLFAKFHSGPSMPRNGSMSEQQPPSKAHRRAESQEHSMSQVELPEAVATLTDRPSHHVRAQTAELRTGKASSETPTTSRNSGGSRSSIAKPALDQDTGAPAAGSGSDSGALKSMFPTYDPSVPLSEQRYAPTQICSAKLPRAVISRQSVYEEPESPSSRNGTSSRESSGCSPSLPTSPPRRAARGRWPPKIQTQRSPVIPTSCSTADLKSLWKTASGWKASGSEGRVFCLKLARQTDAPVYTLSSATAQPFWNLRLDPTSASAYVKLTRHDPAKPYKPPKLDLPPSSPDGPTPSHQRKSAGSSSSSPCTGSRASDTKHWHEALTTTLEEQSRQRDPNDGLVALLMPAAATKLAAERANDPASVAAAEKECARLVWDEDTATYYLVLNALAKPFCVTTERNPAYSRVEYTLEHDESPKHIAKLTRDGTGGGWLEVDTGVACQIDSCYILDVVVTALLLIAASEDRSSAVPLGTFAPPPPPPPPPPLVLGGRSRGSLSSWSDRWSKLRGRRADDDGTGGEKSSKEEKRRRRKCKVEGFNVDIASQIEGLSERGCEGAGQEGEDKLPFLGRVVVKLTKGAFGLVLWTLRMLLRCLSGVMKGLHKCVGSKY
ncbi:hypothetical protein E4U32_002830 [Claviceps aff. humidiphila group G2b]|nr:hypothetical protein E4U32_002830 [Claviceps aff. humidiphila group G2b]